MVVGGVAVGFWGRLEGGLKRELGGMVGRQMGGATKDEQEGIGGFWV